MSEEYLKNQKRITKFNQWCQEKLLTKLSGSGGEKELIGCCYCFHNTCKEEPCNSCFEYDKFESDSKPPEPVLEEKFIKTISNPKLHWYYKTPKGEGFLDEPREDDVINIREMVKTLTNKEWVLVKREDLLTLYNLASWYNPDAGDLNIIRKRIKEMYGIE